MKYKPIELRVTPEFTEDSHAYHFKGWRLPGVSGLLEHTGIKEPFDRTFWRLSLLRKGMSEQEAEAEMDRLSEEGLMRGKLVHSGIENAIKAGVTQLPDTETDEVLLGYMPHFFQWAEDFVLDEVLLIEQPLLHPTGCYCGTVDCLAVVDGELMVLDWKTTKETKRKPTAKKWQLYQLTAYLAAINACSGERVLKAANVYLTPSGFKMHRWETDQIMEAWANLQGLLRDYWIEKQSEGQIYRHPDLAQFALSTIDEKWGPFEAVAA